MKNDMRITPSHIRILDTIAYLNAQEFYPLPEGVYKILAGVFDAETEPFTEFETYSTLISSSSRKIARQCHTLQDHGYLAFIHDAETDGIYLRITEKGGDFLEDYFARHTRGFQKKKGKTVPTIVHIDIRKIRR